MFGGHLVILQMLLNPDWILWSCQIFNFSYLAVTEIQVKQFIKSRNSYYRKSYCSKVLIEIIVFDKIYRNIGWKQSNRKLLQFTKSHNFNYLPDDGIELAVLKLKVWIKALIISSLKLNVCDYFVVK